MSSKRIYQHFIKRTAAEGKSIVAWDNNRRYEGVFRSFDPTGEFVILSDVWVSEGEETIFVSEMLLPLDSLTIVSAGLPVTEEEAPPAKVPEIKEAPSVEEKPAPSLSPEKEEAFREVMEKKEEEVPEEAAAKVTPLKEEAKEEVKETPVKTPPQEEKKVEPKKEEETQPFTLPEKKPSRLSGLKKLFRRGEKKPKKELAPPVPPTPAAAKKEERSTIGWARRVPRFPVKPGKPPVPPQVIQRKSAEVSASSFFSQENMEAPSVPSRRVDIGTLILDILIGILVLVAIAIVIMGFLKVKLPLPF